MEIKKILLKYKKSLLNLGVFPKLNLFIAPPRDCLLGFGNFSRPPNIPTPHQGDFLVKVPSRYHP